MYKPQNKSRQPAYIDVAEAMRITGWSERTTRAVMRRDDAPIAKVGARRFFNRELFDDYLKQLAREQAQLKGDGRQ